MSRVPLLWSLRLGTRSVPDGNLGHRIAPRAATLISITVAFARASDALTLRFINAGDPAQPTNLLDVLFAAGAVHLGGIITLTANPSVDVSTSVGKLEPFIKMRCSTAERDPGGGGINVARVVTRMGGDALAIYPAGGVTGQWLNARLQRDGIRTLPIAISGETREDFTVSELSTSLQYRFVLAGSPLAKGEWEECLRVLAESARGVGFVVASGSLPPGVPTDFYARAAQVAKACGARMVVDTSGTALKAAVNEGVFLIKPNLREFEDLIGGRAADEAELIKSARGLISRGRVDIVAVSLGPKGALLISRDRCWRADALPIKRASVVGAGDSFLGAMVWRLANQGDLRSALSYGVAAGSAALLNPGTELCRLDDVIQLLRQVKVSEVSLHFSA